MEGIEIRLGVDGFSGNAHTCWMSEKVSVIMYWPVGNCYCPYNNNGSHMLLLNRSSYLYHVSCSSSCSLFDKEMDAISCFQRSRNITKAPFRVFPSMACEVDDFVKPSIHFIDETKT